MSQLLHKIAARTIGTCNCLLKLAKVTVCQEEKAHAFPLPALCYSSMRFAKELLSERELEEKTTPARKEEHPPPPEN